MSDNEPPWDNYKAMRSEWKYIEYCVLFIRTKWRVYTITHFDDAFACLQT